MSPFFAKHKVAIGLVGSLTFLVFAIFQKTTSKNDDDFSAWEERSGREKLSLIAQADSLRPTTNVLTESPFADKIAQEAFAKKGPASDEVEPNTPGDQESRAVVSEPDPFLESSDHREFDSDLAARRLLGDREADKVERPQEHQEDFVAEKPQVSNLSENSAITKVGLRSERLEPKETDTITHQPTSTQRLAVRPSSVRRYATTPSPEMLVATRGDSSVLSSMSSGSIEYVGGSKSNLTGGELLKKGSEFVGVIADTIELTPGLRQNVVVSVFGRLSKNASSKPFQMFAQASLSPNGRTILLDVDSCIDSASHTRAIECKGDISGLDGKRGLSDDVYSPTMLASIIRTAGLAASQWSLSSMTQSVTENGVLVDQTQANGLWKTLSSSWQSLGNEVAANVERQGGTVTLNGQKVVKILVTEDVELW